MTRALEEGDVGQQEQGSVESGLERDDPNLKNEVSFQIAKWWQQLMPPSRARY